MLKSIAKSIVILLVKMGLIPETKVKEWSELMYWRSHKKGNEPFSNWHYEEFYTTFWGIPKEWYKGKHILDIGCGPRGSLEWANICASRTGIDPLANEYLKLGAKDHQMTYVQGYSENMPFENEQFDVVCSLNSIDHVEDLGKSCQEIKRILKPGGTLLLITDIHDEPTINEPQVINWDFAQQAFPEFKVIAEEHYEKLKDTGVYDSLRKKLPFDHKRDEKRYGMLCLRLEK